MYETIELNIKLNGRSKKELSKLLSILQGNVEKIEEEVIKEISTAGNLIVIVTSEKDYFIPISLK